MQMIFVATMGFVMDPKYEQCERGAGICACWLEQPEKEKMVIKWTLEGNKLLSHHYVSSSTHCRALESTNQQREPDNLASVLTCPLLSKVLLVSLVLLKLMGCACQCEPSAGLSGWM